MPSTFGLKRKARRDVEYQFLGWRRREDSYREHWNNGLS